MAVLQTTGVHGRLEQLDHVALDGLLTLDFETMLAGTGMSWSAGEPVQFDEQAGIAIFQVDPESLRLVLSESTADVDPRHAADLAKLRSFVSVHGANGIYELATF